MTKKLKLGSIITAVLAIGLLGAFSSGINTNNLEDANMASSQIDNAVSYMAYAEKPVQEIVLVDVSGTDYGSGSTFDITMVECKISTKGGVTTVNWCKATGIMNKVEFEDCLINPEICFLIFFEVFEDIIAEGADFDKALVEFEVEHLTDTIDGILTATYPGIIIPEYEEKSVELEMSVQNDGSSQTKVVVGIEYT